MKSVKRGTNESINNRWDTIQNVFYRKDEIYQMAWKVPDLSDYLVEVAKNGGPIGQLSPPARYKLESMVKLTRGSSDEGRA